MNTLDDSSSVCDPSDEQLYLTSNNVSSQLYSRGDKMVICIIMPVILSIGVLSNGAFLIVIARVSWMRRVSSNIYLACLAVVDITFLIAAVSGKLSRFLASPIVSDDSILGVAGCVSLYLVSDTCFFVSLFLITLVSFERYSAVCHPFAFMSREGATTGLPVVGRIAGCWIVGTVAALLLIPDRLVWKSTCITSFLHEDHQHIPRRVGQCTYIVEWYDDFSTTIQIVPFFLTLFVNFTLYALIARNLRRGTKRRRGLSSDAIQEHARVRDQITRMLVVNGTTYFVCLVPFEAMVLSLLIKGMHGLPSMLTEDQTSLAFNIGRCFLYINSAINPFIYTIISPAYRSAFVDTFRLSRNLTPDPIGTSLPYLPKPIGQNSQENH